MEASATGMDRPASGSVKIELGQIEALLEEIIRLARLNLKVNSRSVPPDASDVDGPEWVVEFSGLDSDLLLEAKAELLDSLAYIACKAVRLDESLQRRVVFDCHGYRKTRTEELKLTAQLAAERVIDSGEPFTLNPMNAADRRIIHLALKDQPLVRTESQGAGSARQVVILPRKNV
jgi:spoIIIJ-associated protein